MLNFYADEWQDFIDNCGFTDDELEIVKLLQRGWYIVDIAAELNVSERTVNRRKKKIKAKIIRHIEKAR